VDAPQPFADFGRRLNEQMTLHGVKAKAISIKLHVSLNTVDVWRSGESLPQTPNDVLLAQMFDVTPGYLLYGEGESTAPKHLYSPVMAAIEKSLGELMAQCVTDQELMPVLQGLRELAEAKKREATSRRQASQTENPGELTVDPMRR
jgi:transcriptional regulator with XRE-family HTH domain